MADLPMRVGTMHGHDAKSIGRTVMFVSPIQHHARCWRQPRLAGLSRDTPPDARHYPDAPTRACGLCPFHTLSRSTV